MIYMWFINKALRKTLFLRPYGNQASERCPYQRGVRNTGPMNDSP
jgi:hypothetical protein